MLKASVYNFNGEKSGDIELSDKIFGMKMNSDLVHYVIVTHLSNSRKVLASAKNRGEVRGGGKKPWRQKGTGRARHGSIRSPIWKGGGVVFGPRTDRNFKKKINKKIKRKALFMVLSSKFADNELVVIDTEKLEKISTKKIKNALSNLPIKKGKTLMSFGNKDENMLKSIRNIKSVSVIASDSLNVVDLLKNKNFIISKNGIDKISEVYKF